MNTSAWPPRDWRMLFALGLLAVAGAGAWLLAKWSLDKLVALATVVGAVWPVAYYAYGALAILAIPSMGLVVILGLKKGKVDLPGGSGAEFEGTNA